MSWFGLLQNKRDDTKSLVQDHGDASSPTEWEVLSEVEGRAETPADDADDGSVSEDETLTVIEAEDDMKIQIEALRKQMAVSLREKQSLEERLRQLDGSAETLKAKSNRAAAGVQAELNEAHQEVRRHQSEVDAVKQKMARIQEEMKVVAEESHQAQVRARLEMKGTRLVLEEKSQQATKAELNVLLSREELDAAKKQIDKLVPETKSLKENLAQAQELNGVLEEQSRCLEKEIRLLKKESSRMTIQNSQVLTILGVRTLEHEEAHAFATRSDLASDAEVIKMLEELNAEIFETAAYMADSFTFSLKPTKTDEVREAYSRAHKMLGSAMVLSLTSVRHDEDPLIVQIACQACMVECCRRIIASWCFDGSKAEEVLPDLYSRIRNTGKSEVLSN
jgi:predicted  nucleic acid-binding Zn-ribbon protein